MNRARILLLVLPLLVVTGCRTGKRGPGALGWLRGQPVLVVSDGEAPDPRVREAELGRALSTVPLRTWPGEADEDLAAGLAAGVDRVAAARAEAEERRIPWLLVSDGEAVRVETARGGEVKWTAEPRPGGLVPATVAATLLDELGAGDGDADRALLDGPVRLVPPPMLAELRTLAVQGQWDQHRERVGRVLSQWPADPAALVHSVLGDLLGDRPSAEAEATLRRAVTINPEGEPELLAVALLAEDAGRTGMALRAREHLVRLHPGRPDYRPPLADLQGELGDDEAAIATLRGGLSTLDAEALDDLPRGTAPHDQPLALPYADLRFALAWYLAQQGRRDLALLSYDKAREVYDALERPVELADTMNNAGVVLVEAGRPAVAVPLFRKALRARSAQGRARKAANSRHNLARALADSRRVPEAIDTWEAAAADYEALGDPLAGVESLYETMEHHAKVGDAAALEERARTLLATLEGLDPSSPRNASLRGLVWFELGRCRMILRDPEAALEAYTVSLDIYQRMAARLDEAQTLYSMAIPNVALMRFDDAWRNLVDAMLIAIELNDTSSIVSIREQLGEIAALIEGAGRPAPELPPELEEWVD